GKLCAYEAEDAKFYPPHWSPWLNFEKKRNLRAAIVVPSPRCKSNKKPSNPLDASNKAVRSTWRNKQIALLYYIYTEGRIDPLCPFMFNNSDHLLIEMLVIKLKGGGWKTLDERINSPAIAMAVINVSLPQKQLLLFEQYE
ncbi:hypothetical protein TNCV_88481, partial [Trichonephila clavipes]